jgi:hypothetical protein
MKKVLLIYSLLMFSLISFAQFPFNSGNAELDADLNRINTSAKLDFGSFKTELAVSFNIEEKKIDFLRTSVKMEPAEIYFALELSSISKKPIDNVVEVYKNNKEKGWGFIAKQLGIKPGSPEFHQLKDKTKNKESKGKGKGKEKKGKGKK